MDLKGNKTTENIRLSHMQYEFLKKNNEEFTKWKMLPHAY